mmetsp:Transcript_21724/g.33509  ORF Transcript_21724/g.33509 Transcript_21724/m.33509 type:complete len:224 (+) Transcript_21724:40-711(+)
MKSCQGSPLLPKLQQIQEEPVDYSPITTEGLGEFTPGSFASRCKERLGQGAYASIAYHYKLKKLIGKGEGALVYKAVNYTSQEEVSIKVLFDIGRSEVALRAAIRELSIMRQFSAMGGYAHTVPLLYAFTSKEENGRLQLILITEYIHRGDMERYLNKKERDPITSRCVLKLVYSLLCLLKFMHSAGVIHRDIHPKNLLLTSESRLLLNDFGLARSLRVASKD